MTIGEFIRKGESKIQEAGVECANPHQHMKQIVGAGLGVKVSELPLHWDEPLEAEAERKVESIFKRRLRGEPLQYIERTAGFWNHEFEVFPGVLIPRKETEHLVEALLSLAPKENLKIGELGAGSGNIGISALLERPSWRWHAFELSPVAVDCAKGNANRLLGGHNYSVHQGDFFSLASWFEPFDWIVSNPPYVASRDIPDLSMEVRQEPKLALDGGVTGTELIARLLRSAKTLLVEGGGILFEIGATQKEAVLELMKDDFVHVEVMEDYSGLPRVVFGRLRKGSAWTH